MKAAHGQTWAMAAAVLFCQIILHAVLIGRAFGATSAVDVARNKPVEAMITCGTKSPETYTKHSQTYLPPTKRTLYMCYNGTSHPASAMVDGNPGTWWQSTARAQLINAGFGLGKNPEAKINIDLEQYFEIDRIIISMGDSKRPGAMKLYKSVDGIRYTDWIYRVTNEQDCTNIHQIPVLASPRNPDSRICSSYRNRFKANNFEKITFDLSAVDPSLAAWRNLRFLRIEFYNMALTLGINGGKFQHYTVSELAVHAECVCNGQALSCQLESATGRYQCVCGGNTTGLFCEKCDPLFNQFEFFYGRPCEQCNCFGHADSCFYDAVTAKFSRSQDIKGVYRGGGVCNDCQHLTAGVNCDECQAFHYRPLGVDQRSVNACVPCDCNGPGVAVNPLTGFTGDCIMNDDNLLPIGMVPGDCICKLNVTGSKCDQCKVGFYGLDPFNPSGCTDCACNTTGTVAASLVCNVTNGQCPCKTHLSGEHCDSCQDEFYGMTLGDPDGCKACQCDVGGSEDNVCDKGSGQCPCRKNIATRQCTEPEPGSYSPDPHFLHGEFESIRSSWDRTQPGYRGFGYATLSETVAGLTYITVPSGTNLGGQYYLLLRYEASGNVTGQAFIFASGVPTVSTELQFSRCASAWCFLRVSHSTDRTFTLAPGKTYTVRISVNQKIKLDQAVILPWEFTNGTVPLGAEAFTFHAKCDVFSNDMKLGSADEGYCLDTLFSLTSYYLGRAMPCNCHFLGTVLNTTCDSYGGQCQCNTGVGGRRCDHCLIEYFNIQAGGCQPCGCGSDYKVCDSVTGHCVCPPNIVGRKCDQCMVNHWNWTAQHGCEPCECNPIGAASLQCNATTGVCACKPGVMAPKCQECLPGYRAFSWIGCVPCNCNQAGSVSDECDARSEQCQCKANTAGLHCDQCKGGSYNLKEDHGAGCLECVCMGVTNQCTSSSWKLTTSKIPVVGSGANNHTTNFDIVTESETVIVDLKIVDLPGLKMAEAAVGSQPRQYWALIEGLKGNLVALFGNKIEFTVHYTADDVTGLSLVNNKLIIISNYKAQKYYLGVPSVVRDVTTELNVTVTNEQLVGVSENVTRGEFLVGLQDIHMVLIPASYYDRIHTSRIGNIRYQIAFPDGTGSPALSTEKCSCPVGYEGQSCERCAPGYMRKETDTHDYLGVCRPCECHNHAAECDPDTGHCLNCRHNTAGAKCEVCSDGFYGSADMGTIYDCFTCPCYEPRVVNTTCLFFHGKVECLYCAPGYTGILCDKCDTFHFGNPEVITYGKCEPCFCNNNTDTCNSKMGECVSCQHETTGFNCENCKDGFYGNASLHDCQGCGCTAEGSQSLVCDHGTGTCDCYDGVGGRTCDACLPNYYGYTNATFKGCVACDCNEFGSTVTQCDDSGVCTCKAHAEHAKCTSCSTGFWGLPLTECQECGCDAVGSVDSAEPCAPVTGQCRCKPGVAGRRCEKCQFLHVDFGPTGCTACSECQFSMGNDTAALAVTFNDYWDQVQMIGEVQTLDSQMQVLTDHITLTSADLGMSEGHLDVLTEGIQNLTEAEPGHNRTVQDLLNRGHTLEDQAERLDNASIAELSRQEDFRRVAQEAHQGAVQLDVTAPGIVARLDAYKTAADQLHVDSGTSSAGMEVNFDTEEALLAETVTNITAVANMAEDMLKQAEITGNMTSRLENVTLSAESQLKVIQGQIADAEQLMAGVKVRADAVADSFNVTKYYKTHAEALYMEAETLISMTESMLSAATAAYRDAQKLLADTTSILHGVASGTLPIDTSVVGHEILLETDNKSVWSWSQASGKLDIDLNATFDLIRSREEEVQAMEVRARELTVHVQAVIKEFDRVRPMGESAVEAINKYEGVARTLEQSVALALEANRTVEEVMTTLQTVSPAALEAQARQSLSESQRLLSDIRRLQVGSEELQQRLLAANTTLTNGVAQWENRYELADAFLKAASAIHELAQEPLVAEPIEDAYIAAENAIVTANVVLEADVKSQKLITAQAEKASLIRDENHNATALVASTNEQLDTFQRVVESDMRTSINEAERLRNSTSGLRSEIEAKMDTIEAKIARALERLKRMEQPVGLSGTQHMVLHNPLANTPPMMHNEIKLQFQVALRAQGVLVFTENNQTDALLKLHIVDGALTFSFNNGDGIIQAMSRADICGGCWFQVIATRFGIDGHLTVIRMSDGAITSAHARGRTRHDRLSLNTPLYVGGVPNNYVTWKVTKEDGDFEGCVNSLYVDGHKAALWENILQHESNAQCCSRPPAPPRPTTVSGAFALSGFGYYQMPAVNVSIATQSHFQFRFRTFDNSGVIMLIDNERVSNYYGLFLVSGKVMLKMGALGWEQSLLTARTYSDGQWYQLTAMHNATSVRLVVEFVDKSVSPLVEVRSTPGLGHSHERLQDGMVTFGSQSPLTETHGPVRDYFAGCISDVRMARLGNPALVELDVGAHSETHGTVSTDYCYTEVTSGLGFTDLTSYARLSNVRKAISIISFTFQTYVSSGILMYAQRPEGIAPYFYIAVFNGDVLVMFNQGRGIKSVLRTRGMYLSDGREHDVLINFSYQNNPRLTVNSEIHHGAIEMNPNMAIIGGPVYIGGVPDTILLPTQFPVHTALIGGLRNLVINTQLVDLYSPSQLDIRYQRSAWLLGLPLPPISAPPLPYSTTPAPPTTPHPKCASPSDEMTLSKTGMRFGHHAESYVAFNTSVHPKLFVESFTITIEFRAVQPNGLLAYAAGTSNSNPTYYFALFLEEGHIIFNMDTNSVNANANPSMTKRIKSRYAYNTGQWVEVTVLRINDFVALVVTKNRDYKNNGVSSTIPSTLSIKTLFYVGGVPASFVGLPFGGLRDIPMGNVPFHGCIRKVQVATHSPEPVIFDLTRPDTKAGTVPCFDNVQPGIFLNGSDAYVRIAQPNMLVHNIVPGFHFRITFHGTVRDGALLIAYKRASEFFLVELFQGEVRSIMSDSGDATHPLIFSSAGFLGPYALCDNEPHTIDIILDRAEAIMQVDNNLPHNFRFPVGFLFIPFQNVPIYVGGHPDHSWVFPIEVTKTSFHGCLTAVTLSGVEYMLAQMEESVGAMSGCPVAPDKDQNLDGLLAP